MNKYIIPILNPSRIHDLTSRLLLATALGASSLTSALAEATPTKRIDRPPLSPELGGEYLWTHQYPDGSGYQTSDMMQFKTAEKIVELRWYGVYTLDLEPSDGVGDPALPGTDTWQITFRSDNNGRPGASLYSVSLPAIEVASTQESLAAFGGTNHPRYFFSHTCETAVEIPANTPFWVSVLSKSDTAGSAFAQSSGSTGEIRATGHAELAAADLRDSPGSLQVNLSNSSSGSGGGARAFTLLTLPVDDADDDGMNDTWESENGLATDRDDSNEDPDGDGLPNLVEFERQTDPQSPDSDGDGLDDLVESGTGLYVDENDRGTSPNHVDSDGDGLDDAAEVPSQASIGLSQSGTHPLMPDSDGDGLADRKEIALGTDPKLIDSDGDSISDNWEILNATNPNDPYSPVEVAIGSLDGAVQTWRTLQQLPSFDGYRGSADRQDATFSVSIDFDAKPAGERELIFETGGGRVGYSLSYEAGNKLVLRAIGNLGLSMTTIEGVLRDEWIEAGELEVVWSYDVLNTDGTQTVSLWVGGHPISEIHKDIGGDWSGNNAASFGIGGTRFAATGVGSVAISGADFTSGTINLTKGLQYFPQIPVIESIERPPLRISSIHLNEANQVVLNWGAHPGTIYAIDRSNDLLTWIELDDDFQSQSITATWIEPAGLGTPAPSYYRVRSLSNP